MWVTRGGVAVEYRAEIRSSGRESFLETAAVSMSVGVGAPRVSPGAARAVEVWLTDRDRGVLAVLEEHFTFSTSQLATLAGFTSVVTAGHRLATLADRQALPPAR